MLDALFLMMSFNSNIMFWKRHCWRGISRDCNIRDQNLSLRVIYKQLNWFQLLWYSIILNPNRLYWTLIELSILEILKLHITEFYSNPYRDSVLCIYAPVICWGGRGGYTMNSILSVLLLHDLTLFHILNILFFLLL